MVQEGHVVVGCLALNASFEPLTMVVDPTEMVRARRMLSSEIEILEVGATKLV